MKAKNLILPAITILFFALPLFAQRVEISKEDFLKKYDLMRIKTESEPRRIKDVFEQSVRDGRVKFAPQELAITIVPPDKVRYYSKFSDIDRESLYIGDTEYEKVKGIWEKTISTKQDLTSNLIALAPEKPGKVKWYLTENVSAGGQVTNLIEWIFTEDFQVRNRDTDLPENYRLSIEIRYWINADNLLVKSERLDTNTKPETSNLRFSREYSYDKNLKIEAPIK